MRQATLASVSFERYGKTTRRGAFLAEMERVVPWQQLCERWLGESEQSDKWIPCLIAAMMPRSRREHVETITAQP